MAKAKYEQGELILCYHGPLIYDAKVLDVDSRSGQYRVHYNGWNRNWDEWVDDKRMLKYDEAGLRRQREEQDKHRKGKKPIRLKNCADKKLGASGQPSNEKSVPSPVAAAAPTPTNLPYKRKSRQSSAASGDADTSAGTNGTNASSIKAEPESATAVNNPPTPDLPTPKPTDNPAVSKRKKRVSASSQSPLPGHPAVVNEDNISSVQLKKAYLTKPEIRIDLPTDLKAFLVDDWDLVTRQHKLVTLPARVTVETVLQEYVVHKEKEGGSAGEEAAELAKGIREYFNAMLGCQLLYPFERFQYADILKVNRTRPLSQVYGPSHLLRFLTKLGVALAFTTLNAKSIQYIVTQLEHNFIKFLAAPPQMRKYLQHSDYFTATPDYHRKSQ